VVESLTFLQFSAARKVNESHGCGDRMCSVDITDWRLVTMLVAHMARHSPLCV
jgi:hypothetical protein